MAEKPKAENLYSYNGPPPSYEESMNHQKIEEAPIDPSKPAVYTQGYNNIQNYYMPSSNPFPRNVADPPFYPGQQVVIPAAFDAGARFSAVSPPSIPPPPPGVAPNAAQLAAQSGASIVASQKKGSFW